MSRKPSKPETRIEDYLDVMTGGNAALPQPILRIEFYYAFLAGMTVELPQPILDDEKLLAKICGMEVEAPTYIPGLFPRLYAYMAKKGGQDVQVPDPILRLERYWYDYSAGEAPSAQEYTGAVPVTFVADGTPLLDYIISGNTVQDGTPTPDNPVMPQGTGERTGNLWDEDYANISSTAIYRPLFVGDGVFTLSTNFKINNGITDIFLLSGNVSSGISSSTNGAYEGKNITAQSVDGYITIAYRANARPSSGSLPYCKTMLNSGSTALPYEPYGYKIPISSANTTTPVYLGEVETTRRIKKLVLTGEESWSENTSGTNTFRGTMSLAENNMNYAPGFCTHVEYVTTGVSRDMELVGCLNSNIYLRLSRAIVNTLAGFKAYLRQQYANGTPVTVWYVLAEPETGIVDEPLMRIGDYSDTLSMEQAGVQIPTASGSTTLDVETTVPPSEVYIKYHGEAVATLSMLSAEVSSPEGTPEEVNPEETEETENEC